MSTNEKAPETTDAAEHLPESPADFDLMSWLDTGTIGRTEVITYNDPVAARRAVEIEKRLAELDPQDSDRREDAFPVDAPLDEPTEPDVSEELQALYDEAEQVHERLTASRMTWTVRATSRDEVQRIERAHKIPVPPTDPGPTASLQQRDKYNDRMVRYFRDRDDYNNTVKLEGLALAVETVTTVKGTSDVTLPMLKALQGRPHGEGWIDRLHQAALAVMVEEKEIPRPTSPGRSTSTRG